MTELHVHLDGSLRPDTVWELAERQSIALQTENSETLAEMLTVPADCRDLNQYLACFDLPLQVLQEPEYVARAVTELIQDMAAEGVLVDMQRIYTWQFQVVRFTLKYLVVAEQEVFIHQI